MLDLPYISDKARVILNGEALALFRPQDLDMELWDLYYWLTNDELSEVPSISSQEWEKQLSEFISLMPAMKFSYISDFHERLWRFSDTFLLNLAQRLQQIRVSLRAVMPSGISTSRQLENVAEWQVVHGGRSVLLPLSFQGRLRLLLQEDQLPFVEIFAVADIAGSSSSR